jgi:hypothetical protein
MEEYSPENFISSIRKSPTIPLDNNEDDHESVGKAVPELGADKQPHLDEDELVQSVGIPLTKYDRQFTKIRNSKHDIDNIFASSYVNLLYFCLITIAI